ncbi:hypothetical protein CWB98_07355 [Pseudoalteromonas rubra]|uniref:Uncharacterized protein n=1 Tax=Pseudoalteromonas rubra TaxID=43658 RepID=A0A5S3X2D7_9GAMM|nr:hypothetical protein CWB98_07355 [Pseudoalteromonas rubra]
MLERWLVQNATSLSHVDFESGMPLPGFNCNVVIDLSGNARMWVVTHNVIQVGLVRARARHI